MITFGVTPTWTVLLKPETEEKLAVHEILSCSNPARFRAIKLGHYGVPKRLYFLSGNKFPTGFLPKLTKELDKRKIPWRIGIDRRQRLEWAPPTAGMFGKLSTLGEELYPQQVEAIFAALQSRGGYIRAGTGAGKTEILFGIYECARQVQPVRALLIVTKDNLHRQALERIHLRFGKSVPVYEIRGERTDLPDHGLVVTTYQTLARRLFGMTQSKAVKDPTTGKTLPQRETVVFHPDPKVQAWVKGVQLAFIDECQSLSSATGDGQYLSCVQALEGTCLRVGFSATPILKNVYRNAQLRGWLGEQLYHYKDTDRIAQDRVAISYIYTRTVGNPDDFVDKDYGEEMLQEVLYENEPYIQAILGETEDEGCRWYYRNNLPTLVAVDRKAFGMRVTDTLQQHFPPHEVAYVDGDLRAKEYDAIIKRFVAEEVKIIVATQKIGVGEDIPNICGLILACMIRSPHTLIQKIGRADRDKRKLGRANAVYVLDLINMRHADCMSQALERIETYRKKKTYVFCGDAPMTLVGS